MIISNSRRFIFVHIHKTGGTSIAQALEPALRWNDIECGGTEDGMRMEAYFSGRFGLSKHSSAQEIRDVVGAEVWEEYFTFSMVRNPYNRVLSLYTWLARIYHSRGLSRYTRHFLPERGVWRWPGMKAYIATRSFSEFIRHDEFLANAPGAKPMFERLSNGSELIVDYVGKLESAATDFDRILNSIPLKGIALEKKNVSNTHTALERYYKNQKDLDYVYNLYKQDFEVFGYDRM